MVWCGNTTESDGIEKYPGTCPGYDIGPECSSSAQSVFWATASQHVSSNMIIMIGFSLLYYLNCQCFLLCIGI